MSVTSLVLVILTFKEWSFPILTKYFWFFLYVILIKPQVTDNVYYVQRIQHTIFWKTNWALHVGANFTWGQIEHHIVKLSVIDQAVDFDELGMKTCDFRINGSVIIIK